MCQVGVPPQDNAADQIVTLPECDRKTNELVAIYTLGPVMLTGDSLETARSALPSGEWVVNPVFKGGADGIDKFNLAAQACNSKSQSCPTGQLAIVLDARVISAPGIQQASFERDQIQISGSFDERGASDLATVLKYGALPVELEQQQAQIVSATLGRDALRAGLWAGLVGFILVAAYMIVFYRILGVLAVAKLAVEVALLWSVISWLGQSQGLALTLAGVTGLIVSIGVSVDSNVVYYEHLKEDVRNGRTIRSATDKSFATSFRTIVAADMASLIGAGLLWWLTIGPVRGFALFLALSTTLDLFASYFFMRPAVRFATQSDMAAEHPKRFGLPTGPLTDDGSGATRCTARDRGGELMNAIVRAARGENAIDFGTWWKRGLVLSAVFVTVSIVSLFARGLNLGIDFEGGTSWEVPAPGVSVSDAREELGSVGEGQAKIQIVGSDILRVQVGTSDPEIQEQVRQTLAELAAVDTAEVSVSTVGPSWGDEITRSAERALVIFLLVMLIYLSIRLEWQMAVGTVVAMVHDVIISVGVYSVFQFEVTPGTVIAFLTILGYSIYDTIVVFDKVKENEGRVGVASRMTYTDMVSLSMNQVLLRSINTTVVAAAAGVVDPVRRLVPPRRGHPRGVRPGTLRRHGGGRVLVDLRRRADRHGAPRAGSRYRSIRERVDAGAGHRFIGGDPWAASALRCRRPRPRHPQVSPTSLGRDTDDATAIPPRPRKKSKGKRR